MEAEEELYLEDIEKIIERFGDIQKQFIMDKKGIHAIIKFIEDFSGAPQSFSLDDPVIQKGKAIVQSVISEIEKQLESIEKLKPPEVWLKFHKILTESIKMQLEGYKEMAKVFKDKNTIHIASGQKLVNLGMKLLEAGDKNTEI